MPNASIFICDFGRDKPICQSCGGVAPTTCTFELRGRLAGRTCGRGVCATCANGTKLCPPHQKVKRS